VGLEITVLCSLGQHPGSGRPRCATADVRALALALQLGAEVSAVHVGDPESAALRDYLGQTAGRRSLECLDVIDVPTGRDIRPALIDYLRQKNPDVILAGTHAECGEGSGMLAYDLAAALGHALVANIDSLSVAADGSFELTQVLARGRRRALGVDGPLIATIGAGAAVRPVFAYARAVRGQIRRLKPAVECPLFVAPSIRPARARPKRLRAGSGNAAERLRAASETPAGQGRLLVDPSAEEAALAIADYLRAEGLWPPS
jgi:electron transfer flavoprotein beta subunit